jgi:hypothetical protein
MPLYVLRMRDGNCVIAYADNEANASQRAQQIGESGVATIRQIDSFVAQFSLSNDGELKSALLDRSTVADLHRHEYPMLAAATAHAYEEFGSSETDSREVHVLYDHGASSHAKGWDERDKKMIEYAVRQERLRLAN